MTSPVIAIDDPRTSDVRALLEQHLRFAHLTTPVEHIHAPNLDGLLDPAVTVFGLRANGKLRGTIKQFDAHHRHDVAVGRPSPQLVD